MGVLPPSVSIAELRRQQHSDDGAKQELGGEEEIAVVGSGRDGLVDRVRARVYELRARTLMDDAVTHVTELHEPNLQVRHALVSALTTLISPGTRNWFLLRRPYQDLRIPCRRSWQLLEEMPEPAATLAAIARAC